MSQSTKIGERHTKHHTYGVYKNNPTFASTKYSVQDEDTGKTVAGAFVSRESAYEWIEEQKKKGC